MAGVTLGFLRYVLGFDSLSFEKGIKRADADLVRMQKRFAQTGANMANLGKSLSLGITAPLAALAGAGIREAQETAAAMAQVNASLASMGPVAGKTAKQLEAAANAFEKSSLFEADQVLKDVTATMLTFGNVTGKTFDRAQQAALDLATKFQKGLPEAAVMVGKALQDPLKGLTALSRVGVSFTASQTAMIKSLVATGQAAKAQEVILAALESQVKGSAQAAQDADPWNKAADAFRQMAEAVGTALLPLIPPLTAAIVAVTGAFTSLSPETQKWVLIAAAAAAALGPFLVVLGNLVMILSKIGPLVSALAKAWGVLKTAFLVARVAALATLPALLPFLVPLGAIALAVGAVYLAWKNWDKIAAIAKAVYTAVKTWVMDKLGAVWDWVIGKIKAVTDAFKRMYDLVVGNSYVPDMVDGIAEQMKRLDAVMVAPVTAATGKAAEAFRQLQEATRGLLDRLFPESAAFNAFKADVATLEAAMQKGILTAEQYAAALGRLHTEGLTDVPVLEGAGDQPLSIMTDEIDWSGLEAIGTQTFSRLSESAQGLAQSINQSIGDGLRDLMTGFGSLKDVAFRVLDAIADHLLDNALKMLNGANGTGGIGGLIAGLFSSFGGPRAGGGPVSSGKDYLVGEKGPEIFSPGRSGRIVSNSDLRRGGGGWGRGPVNMYITTPDANSFRHSQRQITNEARRRAAI